MSEPAAYESHLSAPTVAFLVSLPRGKQRMVLDLADQLALNPFQVSDYWQEDAVGRRIDNLLIGEFLFIYWVDHAAKEVRITEILKI